MNSQLQTLRDQLDDINNQLITVLAERFRVTQQVGELKRDQHLPPLDATREAEQLQKITIAAEKAGLDPGIATRIMQFITAEVRANHKKLQTQGSTRV